MSATRHSLSSPSSLPHPVPPRPPPPLPHDPDIPVATYPSSPISRIRLSTTPPPPPLPPPPLTPFELTTFSLLRLGSVPMDRFIQNNPSEELEGFDIPLVDPANPHSYSFDGRASQNHLDLDYRAWEEEVRSIPDSESARYLRTVVHRVFGNNATLATGAGKDILRYEFIDELGENRKSCILTIVRPNGASRSYRTNPEFSRRGDAKIAAATIALRMGALPFLRWGEESQRAKLARLDAKAPDKGEHELGVDSGEAHALARGEKAIMEIEACCTEWRAGSIIPQWVYLVEHRLPNAFGCAVKISLSPHVQKTYSVLVNVGYPKKGLAKSACAKLAIEEGILDFIKHGDGLKSPMESLPGGGVLGGNEGALPTPNGPVTLQAFHAALPKPMPDEIGTKNNGDINAIAWLNNMVQFAKGSRMTSAFAWHTDLKLGLHGCLLRLSRPNAPSQSYLVDAVFSKRGDAKLAVCLYACSQGLGNFIRQVASDIDSRITPLMRKKCVEEYFPQLAQGLKRIRHGLRADFQYECDLATFSCTMTVELPNPDVPPTYQSLAQPPLTPTTPAAAASDGGSSTQQPEQQGAPIIPPATPVSLPAPSVSSSNPVPPTTPSESKDNDTAQQQPSPTSSSLDPVIRREWSVPLAYKSKVDARIGVVCLAVEDGLMEFIKSRGRSERERRQGAGLNLGTEEAMARARVLESMGRGGNGYMRGGGGGGMFNGPYRGRGFGGRGGIAPGGRGGGGYGPSGMRRGGLTGYPTGPAAMSGMGPMAAFTNPFGMMNPQQMAMMNMTPFGMRAMRGLGPQAPFAAMSHGVPSLAFGGGGGGGAAGAMPRYNTHGLAGPSNAQYHQYPHGPGNSAYPSYAHRGYPRHNNGFSHRPLPPPLSASGTSGLPYGPSSLSPSAISPTGSGKLPPSGPRAWKEREAERERREKERELERYRQRARDSERGRSHDNDTEERRRSRSMEHARRRSGTEEDAKSEEDEKSSGSEDDSMPSRSRSPRPRSLIKKDTASKVASDVPQPITPEIASAKSSNNALNADIASGDDPNSHKDAVGLMADIDAKLSSVISRLEKDSAEQDSMSMMRERGRGRSADAAGGLRYGGRSTSRRASLARGTNLERSRSVGPGVVLGEDDNEPVAKRLRERSASRGRSRGRSRGSTSRGRSAVRGRGMSGGSRATSMASGADEKAGKDAGADIGEELEEGEMLEEGEVVVDKERPSSTQKMAVDEVLEPPIASVTEEGSSKRKTKTKRKRGAEEKEDDLGGPKAAKTSKRRRKAKDDSGEAAVEEKRKGKRKAEETDTDGESALTRLYEYCTEHHLSSPQLFHETGHSDEARGITDGSGVRVWLILGREKMEHPRVFPTFEIGKQKLAKSVLTRLMKGQQTTST